MTSKILKDISTHCREIHSCQRGSMSKKSGKSGTNPLGGYPGRPPHPAPRGSYGEGGYPGARRGVPPTFTYPTHVVPHGVGHPDHDHQRGNHHHQTLAPQGSGGFAPSGYPATGASPYPVSSSGNMPYGMPDPGFTPTYPPTAGGAGAGGWRS